MFSPVDVAVGANSTLSHNQCLQFNDLLTCFELKCVQSTHLNRNMNMLKRAYIAQEDGLLWEIYASNVYYFQVDVV